MSKADHSAEFKAAVRAVALVNGFKLKKQHNGAMGLNPYVYDFARQLVDEAKKEWGRSQHG